MSRQAAIERVTRETKVHVALDLDRAAEPQVDTGVPFFDHMLTLLAIHGFYGLAIEARGDLEVDLHHTVEDVGLVLGDAFSQALGKRHGLRRYGHAVTPMDDALAAVTVDLSKRPFLVFNVPPPASDGCSFNVPLAKEFFRAFTNRAGMNLHINLLYGENDHHILEAVFKATGRALAQASRTDRRVEGVRSSKGML